MNKYIKGISLHKPSKTSLLRILGTMISLGLVIWLLSKQGWREIIEAIQLIPIEVFLISFVFMILSRLAVTARWHVLLRAASFRINYGQTLRVTFAGLFATNFLPTTIGGDVVRLAGMVRMSYDTTIATASLIVDRLIGMLGMAMALPLAIPSLIEAGGINRLLPQTGSSGAVYRSAIVLPIWLHKLWEKSKQILQKLMQALSIWLKKPVSLVTSFAFTWIHMLCLYGIFYVLLTAMNEEVSFWQIGGLYSLIYFFTLLPISINGYGLQELSITVVFSNLGGVSVGSALTMALLYRTLMLVVSLPGAFTLPGVLTGNSEQSQTTTPDTVEQ
jgi:uncharacterized membrane protein YbhN (UPF0104 family)